MTDLYRKEGLHIIDLDSPYSPPRYLPHHTSWEVADVQWSPHASRDAWVVSTSNQKALLWNLNANSLQDSIEHVFHGHTRAITDINFSAHHPDILATCAVDSFVHCWDVKFPWRPALSFSDWFAGATQVKWSRQDEFVIASSHDRYLRIWDTRKGAYPVRSIEAHDTKIYGIDWNRFEGNKLVTCSLDRTIKFWDINNLEDTPEDIISTAFPVWRARHTPFGWGLLAMPQRGDYDLHLFDRHSIKQDSSTGLTQTVVEFQGHKGQVKEFLWRPKGLVENGVDHREFQLVSWGTDHQLRLHRVKTETLSAVGYEKGVSQTQKLNITRKGAMYKTFRDEPQDPAYSDVFDSQAGSSPLPRTAFPLRPRTSTSIGMSKVALPQSRGWMHDHTSGTRVGMHGRSTARRDMDPIKWMKNVKTASGGDSLADEITSVGERFSKIEFDNLDVRSRRATISMNCPWGPDGEPIYVKIDVRFPKTYPQESIPHIAIQKTTQMTDELSRFIHSELRKIAEAYLTCRKG